MPKPRIFLFCGAESRHIGEMIELHLRASIDAVVVSGSELLGPAGYIDSLLKVLKNIDFGVFVLPPSDNPKLAGQSVSGWRDNLMLELGICIARLGRTRCLLVLPDGKTAGLGSDLVDLRYVPCEMRNAASPQSLRESLFPALVRIERAILSETADSSKSPRTRKRETSRTPSQNAAFHTGGVTPRANKPTRKVRAALPVSSFVFISYASSDREFARSLAGELEKRSFSVWWDRTIPPGKTFDEVIEAAINAAQCVIVLWSEASISSNWVKNEAREGLRRKILIPTLLGTVAIPFEFRHIHAADLTGWPGSGTHAGFESLVASIRDMISSPASTTGAPIS